MAVYDGNTLARRKQENRTAHAFVYSSMALVALAAGVAMYRHGGLPGPAAFVAALAVLTLLYAVHALFGRSPIGIASRTSADSRRNTETRRRAPEPQREPQKQGLTPQPATTHITPQARPSDQHHSASLLTSTAAAVPNTEPSLSVAPSLAAETPPPHPSAPRLRTTASPGLRQSTLQPFAYNTPAPKEETAPPPAAAEPLAVPSTLDFMQDYWSYRPAAPRLDVPPAATAARQPSRQANEPAHRPKTPAPHDQPAPPSSGLPISARPHATAAPREVDVEMVQEAIKRLLEQVNSADVLKAATAPTERSPASSRAPTAPRRPAPGAMPPVTVEQAVDTSLDALRVAAETMRAASRPPGLPLGTQPPRPIQKFPSADTTGAPAASAPLLLGPLRDRAAAIADAITAGRIDVLLEPILALDDKKARHFEISIRLRDASGGPVEGPDRDTQLRGTGLLPLFDCARITRTAAVAQRLEARGKSGAVFSDFNSESLTDDRFLGELAGTLHQRASFATQLVLTFSQSEARCFAGGEWDTIADMRALGFRFSLSDVTDLDMDFEAFAEAGFAFVKLDADMFLNGLPIGGGRIPPNDLCRHLAKLGLTLVVDRIDDEEKRARIFGFGVLFGQGQLFGGPRPVKASAILGQDNAAA